MEKADMRPSREVLVAEVLAALDTLEESVASLEIHVRIPDDLYLSLGSSVAAFRELLKGGQ